MMPPVRDLRHVACAKSLGDRCMANDPLFDAFPAATRAQWEAVITKELKGKDHTNP